MPCCSRRVSQCRRRRGIAGAASRRSPRRSRAQRRSAPPSSQVRTASSGRCCAARRGCAGQPLRAEGCRGSSASHSMRTRLSSAWRRGCAARAGRSVMSVRRWPLCGSRSPRQVVAQPQAGELTRPRPTTQSSAAPARQGREWRCDASHRCLTLPRGIAFMQCRHPAHNAAPALTAASARNTPLPAEGTGDARHAVPGEHAAQVTDAVNDARGGRAGLLAAEVQREGAAEVGIGAEQAEGDAPMVRSGTADPRPRMARSQDHQRGDGCCQPEEQQQ